MSDFLNNYIFTRIFLNSKNSLTNNLFQNTQGTMSNFFMQEETRSYWQINKKKLSNRTGGISKALDCYRICTNMYNRDTSKKMMVSYYIFMDCCLGQIWKIVTYSMTLHDNRMRWSCVEGLGNGIVRSMCGSLENTESANNHLFSGRRETSSLDHT